MASVFTYLCVSCNTDLGAKGDTLESHLVANPTHAVRRVLYDDSHTPSTVEGRVISYNNVPFSYDASRSKWLSVMRYYIGYGIPTTAQKNVYLRLDGNITPVSADMGYYVKNNATITKLIATRTAGKSATIDLRVYGGAALVSIGQANNSVLDTNLAVDTDISAGTLLSSYLTSSSTGSDYQQLVVELAWRI